MRPAPLWAILLIVNLAAMVWGLGYELLPEVGVRKFADRVLWSIVLLLLGGIGLLFIAGILVLQHSERRRAQALLGEELS